MSESLIDNYKARHRHPLNRLSHSIGIPMIAVSLPLFFFSWRWALALFVVGWVFQFVGHAIEGNQPAFLSHPIHLLVGPWWLVRRVAEAVGLMRAPISSNDCRQEPSSIQTHQRRDQQSTGRRFSGRAGDAD